MCNEIWIISKSAQCSSPLETRCLQTVLIMLTADVQSVIVYKRSPSQRYKHWEYFLPLQCITTVTTDVAVQSHLMILLQAPQSGVLPLSSGACCAACRMELRFCIGVGWAGCWCWVTTVLVLSGRKRLAKLGSVTHGGRLDGPELSAAAASAAVLEPEPGKKTKKNGAMCFRIAALRKAWLWLWIISQREVDTFM